ncbi:FlgO family outer membrane protein [Solidesulfovibrio sp. C21]|uniref:FlgO family outer membrane protein n=1 Tax=Solidesulfovibrio sp. C21 TaxID=3398613 RepID=UPI0039FB94E2
MTTRLLRRLSLVLMLPLFAPLLMGALCDRTPPPQPQYPDVAMALAADLDRQLVPRLGMYTRDNSRGLYWVVITTPADLGDLERASPLSRLIGQELSTAFVALGYNVQEIRKASDIIFSRRQGEFSLTRDVRALATSRATATLVVAGTYVVTPGGVRFAIEVVDARNNNIVAAANRTLPMDATVGTLAGGGANYGAPTVSTTDRTSFERDMLPYSMSRHW